MKFSRILFCIFLMAFVTYLLRMLPIAVFRRKIKNRFFQSFLAYIPYAVLAAMTFPEVLYSTSNGAMTLASFITAFSGFLVALILSYYGKGLFTVALSSVAAVYVVGLVVPYIPFLA